MFRFKITQSPIFSLETEGSVYYVYFPE